MLYQTVANPAHAARMFSTSTHACQPDTLARPIDRDRATIARTLAPLAIARQAKQRAADALHAMLTISDAGATLTPIRAPSGQPVALVLSAPSAIGDSLPRCIAFAL